MRHEQRMQEKKVETCYPAGRFRGQVTEACTQPAHTRVPGKSPFVQEVTGPKAKNVCLYVVTSTN